MGTRNICFGQAARLESPEMEMSEREILANLCNDPARPRDNRQLVSVPANERGPAVHDHSVFPPADKIFAEALSGRDQDVQTRSQSGFGGPMPDLTRSESIGLQRSSVSESVRSGLLSRQVQEALEVEQAILEEESDDEEEDDEEEDEEVDYYQHDSVMERSQTLAAAGIETRDFCDTKTSGADVAEHECDDSASVKVEDGDRADLGLRRFSKPFFGPVEWDQNANKVEESGAVQSLRRHIDERDLRAQSIRRVGKSRHEVRHKRSIRSVSPRSRQRSIEEQSSECENPGAASISPIRLIDSDIDTLDLDDTGPIRRGIPRPIFKGMRPELYNLPRMQKSGAKTALTVPYQRDVGQENSCTTPPADVMYFQDFMQSPRIPSISEIVTTPYRVARWLSRVAFSHDSKQNQRSSVSEGRGNVQKFSVLANEAIQESQSTRDQSTMPNLEAKHGGKSSASARVSFMSDTQRTSTSTGITDQRTPMSTNQSDARHSTSTAPTTAPTSPRSSVVSLTMEDKVGQSDAKSATKAKVIHAPETPRKPKSILRKQSHDTSEKKHKKSVTLATEEPVKHIVPRAYMHYGEMETAPRLSSLESTDASDTNNHA